MSDVLIVGAGPTGLMAAALLTRCGVKARVIDKSAHQGLESRAFAVQARSMELFLSMGLADKLLDHAQLATGVRLVIDGKRAVELCFDDVGRDDTPYSNLTLIPQSEVERVLAEDLRRLGVAVEHNTELTAFEQDADGVTAHLQTGESVRCAYLIGADGAHSLVRKQLGLTFEGAPYPQTFLLADCRVDWDRDYDYLSIFLKGNLLAGFIPIRGTGLSRVIVSRPDERPGDDLQSSAPADLQDLEQGLAEASGSKVRLHDPVWTSTYRISHRGTNHYRVGRAFVAGDAAHIHSPAGGQGMNTGLQDAANLAWKLALTLRARAPEKLLDSYHDERWPVGQNVLRYTDRLFAGLATQSAWLSQLRDVLLPTVAGAVSRSGSARRRAFHFISQLGIRYPQSDWVVDDSSKAPSAGQRAPNASFAHHRDVFSLIDGYRFHVLAISRKPLNEAEVVTISKALHDLGANLPIDMRTHLFANSLIGRDDRLHRIEASQILRAYGLDDDTPQALLLVRPDGYIAYRSNRLDLTALRLFLLKLAPLQ